MFKAKVKKKVNNELGLKGWKIKLTPLLGRTFDALILHCNLLHGSYFT